MTGLLPGAGNFRDGKPLGHPSQRLCQCGKVKTPTSYITENVTLCYRWRCPVCDLPEAAADGTKENPDPA